MCDDDFFDDNYFLLRVILIKCVVLAYNDTSKFAVLLCDFDIPMIRLLCW